MKLFGGRPTFSGLKDYQRRVLDELASYAEDVAYFRGVGRVKNPPAQAFTNITNEAWRPLTENPDTPFVCVKIPTGGGKTLVAAHAAGIVYDGLLQHKQERGVVLWTTPSETIRSQTLRALKDEDHPYRKALESRFTTPVYVVDNKEALSLRPDQIRDGLTVIVSTMQALKRENKEGLKFYEDNGALRPHFAGEDDAGEGRDYSLFEVIRRERPLIIADEGHNAKTGLALDVIESLDPSFVLELTATPLERSNVLSTVTALELKREQMVKLPVNLQNLLTWQDTLREAVQRRQELEEAAKEEREETGEYVRPMLLIQAEVEKASADKVHVARVKDYLVNDLKVPESHVRIRTGKQDELGDTDLMAEDSQVRHIITRDALREGWDAPFAYVLASVFRLSSPTAVEQLLGRVLRLPNVREKRRPELNEAYVYTSAEEFGKVLGAIVKGMVENGYGRDEVRIKDASGKPEPYIVRMEARHTGLTIPLVAVEDSGIRRELGYSRDLLGSDFSLAGLGFAPGPLNDPLAEGGRVDVAEDASLKTEIFAPPASDAPGNGAAGGARDDLVGWLLKKIGTYKEVSDPELLGYVELAVDELLKAHAFDLLHRARYQIRDQIREHLDGHYLRRTGERYEEIKHGAGGKRLVADASVAYAVPTTDELPASQCATSYRKSVFEYPGKLNKEEAELATDLDGLQNVRCWYRNLDKGGFSLQGYWKAKFNPDLIAFTESGKVAALEYKGEDRLSNEDTTYKQALGEDWASLDPDNRYFRVVGKSDVAQTLREVSRL